MCNNKTLKLSKIIVNNNKYEIIKVKIVSYRSYKFYQFSIFDDYNILFKKLCYYFINERERELIWLYPHTNTYIF